MYNFDDVYSFTFIAVVFKGPRPLIVDFYLFYNKPLIMQIRAFLKSVESLCYSGDRQGL